MSPNPPCPARACKQHLPMAAEIQRLLAAIDRGLADAAASTISEETRFDAALKAVMHCAVVAMLAAGHRAAAPGADHHREMLASLSRTLGVGPEVWAGLDQLRRRRLAADYTGRAMPPEATAECIAQAVSLRRRLHAQLAAHHPDLLAPAD